MSHNDAPTHSFLAGEAMGKYRLVVLDAATSEQVLLADAGDHPVAVTTNAVASGLYVSCWLLNKQGTVICKTNAAIAMHAPVWCVEDGKVDDVGIGDPIGWALQLATAENNEIEILPNPAKSLNDKGDRVVLEEDFFNYVDADKWTLVGSDGGTVAIADAVGGVITIDTGATTDNHQLWLEQKLETWKFAAAKPLYLQMRVTNTEVGSDVVNWWAGLMDAVADDALQDDGAGPKASYSGAGFFVVDGGTVIQCESSVSTTQVTDTDVGARTDGVQMKLEILFVPTSTTAARVFFILNGALVKTNAMTFTGATEMQICFGVKNGGAGGAVAQETLDVDYVYCEQVR